MRVAFACALGCCVVLASCGGDAGSEERCDALACLSCDDPVSDDDRPDAPGVVELAPDPEARASGVACEGDVDWFRVDLAGGEEIAVELDAPHTVNVALVGDGGETIAIGELAPEGRALAAFASETGAHFVRVTAAPGDAAVPYELVVRRHAGLRYFVSPDGDDAAAGDFEAPWGTIGHGVASLTPGDTLVVMPGTFTRDATPIEIDCGGAAMNGEPDAPIRVIALRERQSKIERILAVRDCAYWHVEGLWIDGADDPDSPIQISGMLVSGSHDIVVRRMLFTHSNRFMNAHTMQVSRSVDVLVEESEVYWYHRVAFFTHDSERVIIRRNYSNSRGYTSLVAGDPIYPSGIAAVDGYAASYSDRGDAGVMLWGSNESMLVENHVDEGSGIGLDGDATITGHRFLGCASVGARIGFLVAPGSGGQQRGTTVAHGVAVGAASVGIYLRSALGATLDGCTAVGADIGFHANDETGGVQGDFTGRNLLAVDNRVGFDISDQTRWEVRSSAAWGNEIAYSPAGSPSFVGALEEDPQLAGCVAYVPESSPMHDRGEDGEPIGADLTHRFENGDRTAIPLWDPLTGRFPCGATIPGINDDPTDSCVGLHARLSIGTGTCRIPRNLVPVP